jgi:serine/threonine protein kinase
LALSIDSPGVEQSSSGRLPELGSLIADRYRILELVGRGGMGAVYRAEHIQLQRNVAVKLLLGDFDIDSPAFKRFQQEARTASMLDHPNIVSVHDFGMIGGRQPYLAMDYIAGVSLDDLLTDISVLPLDRFRHIFAQACDALDHAHLAGVVHRDIKPSNLMLVQKRKDADFLKIVDFGLVKLMSFEGDEKLTSSNTLVGSPLYMSPEQCRGLELDQRSDIYSLGCVMYRALSGTLPVHGESPLDTLYKHVSVQPRPISQVNPQAGIPQQLEAVIMKSLSKSPDDRQQTMGQLREEMEAALPMFGPPASGQSWSAVDVSATQMRTEVIPNVVALAEPKKSKISISFWLAPLLGLLLIGGLMYLSLYRAAKVVKYATDPTPAKVIVVHAAPEKPTPAKHATHASTATHASAAAVNAVQALAPAVHKPAAPKATPGENWEKQGDQLQQQYEFKPARDAFEKALELKEAAYGVQSKQLMPTLGNLVTVSHAMRDLPATMLYFRRFTDIYAMPPATTGAPPAILQTVASTAVDLGHFHAGHNQPEAAERYYKWALEISKTIPDTHEWAQNQYETFLRKREMQNDGAILRPRFSDNGGPMSRFRKRFGGAQRN